MAVRNFLDQKYWAEGGLVRIVDERTGEYESLSTGQFQEHIRAFVAALKRMPNGSAKTQLARNIEKWLECLEEAKNQGDPTIPQVRREILREKGNGRIVVPGHCKAGSSPLAKPTAKELSIFG